MAVFTVLLLEDFATCPRLSIKKFELYLLLGSSSWKLNYLGKYLFQYYSVVGKLAHFTIIYALFLTLTETVFEYAMCRQCGCRIYLE